MPSSHPLIILAFQWLIAKITPTIDHLLWRTATDTQLQTSAGDQVRSAGILRHVVRIFIAHVDHRGADLNPLRLGADRREQWERRCQLPRKVMDTKVGSIHSQTLGLHSEVNRLQERICCRPSL